MLHGDYLFDRLETLQKSKIEKDEDKMIVSVGREYLRRVHQYIEKVSDYKIPSILCRDSDRMNSADRWQIRLLPPKDQRGIGEDILNFFIDPIGTIFGSTDDQPETQSIQTEKVRIVKREQNGANQAKDVKQDDPIVSSNTTHDNATESTNSTQAPKKLSRFEVLVKQYNQRIGDNFARLLMKRYRKEKLEQEEIDYLARWLSDESIHYGMMGIYCDDGQNLDDLTKRIRVLIEEKQ